MIHSGMTLYNDRNTIEADQSLNNDDDDILESGECSFEESVSFFFYYLVL